MTTASLWSSCFELEAAAKDDQSDTEKNVNGVYMAEFVNNTDKFLFCPCHLNKHGLDNVSLWRETCV